MDYQDLELALAQVTQSGYIPHDEISLMSETGEVPNQFTALTDPLM